MTLEQITTDMTIEEAVNTLIINTSDRLQALEQTVKEQATRIEELEMQLEDIA